MNKIRFYNGNDYKDTELPFIVRECLIMVVPNEAEGYILCKEPHKEVETGDVVVMDAPGTFDISMVETDRTLYANENAFSVTEFPNKSISRALDAFMAEKNIAFPVTTY